MPTIPVGRAGIDPALHNDVETRKANHDQGAQHNPCKGRIEYRVQTGRRRCEGSIGAGISDAVNEPWANPRSGKVAHEVGRHDDAYSGGGAQFDSG